MFEDLHWSSDSLLDLVEFVMQPRGNAGVLMIALTRPELLDRRQSWGGGKRNHLALSLEPLADDAVEQLVEHVLEARQPDLVERIVARAEGNPFYAGELVRAFMERGGSVDALPDTVQATVLALRGGLAPLLRVSVDSRCLVVVFLHEVLRDRNAQDEGFPLLFHLLQVDAAEHLVGRSLPAARGLELFHHPQGDRVVPLLLGDVALGE